MDTLPNDMPEKCSKHNLYKLLNQHDKSNPYLEKLRHILSSDGQTFINTALAAFKMFSWINQFNGTVIVRTKITAAPRPIAVDTFFETAKKEHMPKK